jgi:hypothetical protein
MAAALVAQQAQPTATVFRADTRIVVCHTTVIDKSGHLVTTLPQSAFTVYENKIKQEIRKFKREDVPVSLGLVIDNSGSMRNKLGKVEAAALALVKDSNRDDEVFIVNFNDAAYLDNPQDKDFTNDIAELETALGRIDARGGTAMRDAIEMSIQHLKKAHRDKKVLVVITDGNDNSSLLTRQTRAQRPGRGHRGKDVLPQGRGGSGCHRAPGGARYPQPVHHRIFALQFGDGRNFPRHPHRCQGFGQSNRAHAQRLLRHAGRQDDGPVDDPRPVASLARLPVDLAENYAFLADLRARTKDLQDGTQVRLVIKPRPDNAR